MADHNSKTCIEKNFQNTADSVETESIPLRNNSPFVGEVPVQQVLLQSGASGRIVLHCNCCSEPQGAVMGKESTDSRPRGAVSYLR
jgi:hypothetical protein